MRVPRLAPSSSVLVDDLATIGRSDAGRLVYALAKLFVNPVKVCRNRTVTGREGDTALVFTADATVPVVKTGTVLTEF